MKRRLSRLLLMVAGIAGAFAVGHQTAKTSRGHEERTGSSPGKSTKGSGGSSQESRELVAFGSRPWAEVRKRIVERWEASPAVTVDFELRDQTMRLLEKVPVADLEVWMKELRPTQWVDDDKDVPLQLRRMILSVLAPRAGSALIQSLAENPTEEAEEDVDDAMDHWLEKDPVAVLDWLNGPVPEMIEDDLDDYREDALVELAGKDPAEFEKRLLQVDAEIREDVLEEYAWLAEERDELLARAARSPHGEAMALWSGLVRREAKEDPTRAYVTLGELEISPDDRAELDERLMFWLLYPDPFSEEKIDGIAVMQAWAKRNPGDEVSESTLESFGRWSGSDPDQAVAWLDDLPSGVRYDAFAKVLIEQRMGQHEEVAGMIERIGDDDVRGAMLRRLKEAWKAEDSAAAAEWESGLPEEDRERLK